MTENPNEKSAVTKGTFAAGFSVASVWFGTHVGAGFATGNQVITYYVQYGWTAVLYPLISMGILAYVIYTIMKFARLRGLPGRRVIAAGFLLCCFTSSTLTVARECVSDYQAYSAADIETAEFVRENTPEHSIFLTGNQHLNPVSSLAGRTILCSSDLYLYYHGFNTTQRQAEIAAFYANPAANLDLLTRYQVQYIYVSPYERANTQYAVNEAALEALFPVIYESAGGQNRIFEVPEEYRQ